MKRILASIIFVLLAGFSAFLYLNKAHADVVPCSTTPDSYLIDVTQQLTNVPDSGNHGNWATDTFSRHLQVWQNGEGYCGKVTDTGLIVTTGPLSPQAGATVSAGLTGTFNGGALFTFTGELKDEAINQPVTLDCSVADTCDSGTLHALLSQYFDGESHNYINWGWTYHVCNHGTWVDSSENEDGSLLADGDITDATTGETCQTSNTNQTGGGTDVTFVTQGPPAAPICTLGFTGPTQPMFTRVSATQGELKWWPSPDTGVTKQSIEYGFFPGQPLWAVDNLPATQGDTVLNALPSNLSIWAQVRAYKGNCTEDTVWAQLPAVTQAN